MSETASWITPGQVMFESAGSVYDLLFGCQWRTRTAVVRVVDVHVASQCGTAAATLPLSRWVLRQDSRSGSHFGGRLRTCHSPCC